MAHYRKIDTRIWNDLKFNQLSDDGKLVFFQLLTHPTLLPIGAMRGSLAVLACDLKWPQDRLKAAFDEIAKREKRTRNKVIELILSGEIITSEDLRREIENIKKLEG